MRYEDLPKDITSGIVRAINRSAVTALNAVVKNISSNYNITSGNLKKLIRITKADRFKLSAILRFRQKSLGLIMFGARRTEKGVSVKIKRSGGRQIRRAPSGGSFIATMPSGHRGVFVRTGVKSVMRSGRYKGKKREKIGELFGPSAADIFKSHRSYDIAEKAFRKAFQKNIESELRYRILVK